MKREEAIVRLWVEFQRRGNWSYDRGYWLYKNAVALGFDQICRKWNGPWGESPIKNDSALLDHLVVVQNGLALEALQELTFIADESRCGIVGVVSPFTLKRKDIYDKGVLIQRMLLGEYAVLPTESATKEIETVCNLFHKAGFEFGFQFQKVMAFGDKNFPRERQFGYLPDGMGEDARNWIESSKLPEANYVDDLDDVASPTTIAN